MSQLPRLLISDPDEARQSWMRGVLEPAGWHVDRAGRLRDADARMMLRHCALLLVNIDDEAHGGLADVAALRREAAPGGSVPVLGIAAEPMPEARVHAEGLDGLVVFPCAGAELVAAAEMWRLQEAVNPRERLAAVLPAPALDAMFARLRAEIADAVHELDRGDVDRDRAHRLAGLAGTLGFTAVHKAWAALSDGDEADPARARIVARLAIVVLDRDAAAAANRPSA
jgi:DNA-binding response OmpR family regulator